MSETRSEELGPLAAETIHELMAERDAALAKVSAVRALHREEWGCCSECSDELAVPWPCPTMLALDRAQP